MAFPRWLWDLWILMPSSSPCVSAMGELANTQGVAQTHSAYFTISLFTSSSITFFKLSHSLLGLMRWSPLFCFFIQSHMCCHSCQFGTMVCDTNTQARTRGLLPTHPNSNDAKTSLLPTLISSSTNCPFSLFLLPLFCSAARLYLLCSDAVLGLTVGFMKGPSDPWSIAVLWSAIEQGNKWSGHMRVL